MSAFKRMMERMKESLGPGFITGASDDDPSGILTYIQSGVVLGLQGLWVSLVSLPLMYGIQEMCGRIGYVTGKGLVKSIKSHMSPWVLYPMVLLASGVVVVNVGADLLAIGVVLEKLSGLSRFMWIPLAGALLLASVVLFSYRKMASVLKWVALSLFFYIACAFFLDIHWWEAIKNTFIPHVSFQGETMFLIAAMIGTTISPYLFFWQVNEEAEEREEYMEKKHLKRFLVTRRMMAALKKDTFVGMLLSNVVMWFIILTASSLGAHFQIGSIQSFDDAALVLEPVLGQYAYLIFCLGIIGTGLLAIPVLAGGVGYMVAETFDWEEGLNKHFKEAEGFYMAIIISVLLGILLAALGLNPVNLLISTALFYSILTPLLILVLLKLGNTKKIMGKNANSLGSNVLGWLAFIATTAVVVGYVVSVLN